MFLYHDPEGNKELLEKAEKRTQEEIKAIEEIIKNVNEEITYEAEEFLLEYGRITAFRPSEILLSELGKEWQIKKALLPYSLTGEILILEDRKERPYKVSRPYKVLGYLALEEDNPEYPWRIFWVTLTENSHIIKFLLLTQ